MRGGGLEGAEPAVKGGAEEVEGRDTHTSELKYTRTTFMFDQGDLGLTDWCWVAADCARGLCKLVLGELGFTVSLPLGPRQRHTAYPPFRNKDQVSPPYIPPLVLPEDLHKQRPTEVDFFPCSDQLTDLFRSGNGFRVLVVSLPLRVTYAGQRRQCSVKSLSQSREGSVLSRVHFR
jgi:hypothetical protein